MSFLAPTGDDWHAMIEFNLLATVRAVRAARRWMELTTGRLLDPQEIADVIVMLVSPRSAGTTGSDGVVDAGLAKTV